MAARMEKNLLPVLALFMCDYLSQTACQQQQSLPDNSATIRPPPPAVERTFYRGFGEEPYRIDVPADIRSIFNVDFQYYFNSNSSSSSIAQQPQQQPFLPPLQERTVASLSFRGSSFPCKATEAFRSQDWVPIRLRVSRSEFRCSIGPAPGSVRQQQKFKYRSNFTTGATIAGADQPFITVFPPQESQSFCIRDLIVRNQLQPCPPSQAFQCGCPIEESLPPIFGTAVASSDLLTEAQTEDSILDLAPINDDLSIIPITATTGVSSIVNDENNIRLSTVPPSDLLFNFTTTISPPILGGLGFLFQEDSSPPPSRSTGATNRNLRNVTRRPPFRRFPSTTLQPPLFSSLSSSNVSSQFRTTSRLPQNTSTPPSAEPAITSLSSAAIKQSTESFTTKPSITAAAAAAAASEVVIPVIVIDSSTKNLESTTTAAANDEITGGQPTTTTPSSSLVTQTASSSSSSSTTAAQGSEEQTTTTAEQGAISSTAAAAPNTNATSATSIEPETTTEDERSSEQTTPPTTTPQRRPITRSPESAETTKLIVTIPPTITITTNKEETTTQEIMSTTTTEEQTTTLESTVEQTTGDATAVTNTTTTFPPTTTTAPTTPPSTTTTTTTTESSTTTTTTPFSSTLNVTRTTTKAIPIPSSTTWPTPSTPPTTFVRFDGTPYDPHYCFQTFHCLNGGVCSKNRSCDCPDGYQGVNCAFIDICRDLPCKNDGECFLSESEKKIPREVPMNGTFECKCTDGWTGAECLSRKLSSEEIAGISVGIIGAIALLVVAYMMYRYVRKSRKLKGKYNPAKEEVQSGNGPPLPMVPLSSKEERLV